MASTNTSSTAGNSSTRRPRANGRARWIWGAALIGVLAAMGLAVGVTWAVTRSPAEVERVPQVSGKAVAEASGRQAPAFTLMSSSGSPYTFTPGDGKKHLFVFFMGYF